jgi:hypothetical protein
VQLRLRQIEHADLRLIDSVTRKKGPTRHQIRQDDVWLNNKRGSVIIEQLSVMLQDLLNKRLTKFVVVFD